MRTILTAMPLSIDKKCQLEKKPELSEVKLGILEGQHEEEFSNDFSRNCYQAFLNDDIKVAVWLDLLILVGNQWVATPLLAFL